MTVQLEELRDDYRNDKIVPFIGSGLSFPFNIPTWDNLIRGLAERYTNEDNAFVKSAVEKDLERYDYWQAIDVLKNYTVIQEEDIQQEVAKAINERQIKINDDSLHNYADLQKMNFKLYLTTNYENILYNYLKYDNTPILLKDIQFNTQDIFDQQRVCQLHGTISNYGTIVLSREGYRLLYENKKYEKLLSLVTGTKKLLFMGFSFNDQFIRTLIKQHKNFFMSKHYIILDNPTIEKIKELREEYGLITIPYTTEGSSHTEEIRKILNKMAEPEAFNLPVNLNSNTAKPLEKIVIGAGIGKFGRNMSNNLFYKKLKLENIDDSMIELSAAFYVASEEYIRELQKAGIPLEIIDAMLGKVFIKYREKYAESYKEHGDSKKFLSIVHSSLSNLDFGRIAKVLKDNISDEDENKGLIHILAEDEKMEIWWGENRC